MKRTLILKAASIALASVLTAGILSSGKAVSAEAKTYSPYETYGDLKLVKKKGRAYLCDCFGDPVTLSGMSTFGLQWSEGSRILNDKAFDALKGDFRCDIVRLAMYVSEGGYASDPAGVLSKVEEGIKLACDRGLYVIVDWHILNPGDPTDSVYLNAGKDLPQYASIRKAHPEYTGPQLFFAYMSQKYGDRGNVLFETANEPNGLGNESNAGQVWKEKLLPYHTSVVKAIREYDKDKKANIVICGTDSWSQFVDAPLASPVQDSAGQIMYTMHFYAGTHDVSGSWLKNKVTKALKGGLAVFVTEWGTSEASGDGGPYINYSKKWLKFLDKNKISRCAWSLSNKNEISAAFKPSASSVPSDHNGDKIPDWKSSELTKTGKFLRSQIRKVGKGEVIRSGSLRFKVLSSSSVKYAGTYSKRSKVKVPSSIKFGGKRYKVKNGK